jgi:hypothetical protein
MTQVRNAGHYLREQMSPWLIALLALITAVAFTTPFLFSERALGTHVSPTFVAGNPSCATVLDIGDDYLFAHKLEPVADATIPLTATA